LEKIRVKEWSECLIFIVSTSFLEFSFYRHSCFSLLSVTYFSHCLVSMLLQKTRGVNMEIYYLRTKTRKRTLKYFHCWQSTNTFHKKDLLIFFFFYIERLEEFVVLAYVILLYKHRNLKVFTLGINDTAIIITDQIFLH
jgi:hypothetical protein